MNDENIYVYSEKQENIELDDSFGRITNTVLIRKDKNTYEEMFYTEVFDNKVNSSFDDIKILGKGLLYSINGIKQKSIELSNLEKLETEGLVTIKENFDKSKLSQISEITTNLANDISMLKNVKEVNNKNLKRN